jgi:hypothetical protein
LGALQCPLKENTENFCKFLSLQVKKKARLIYGESEALSVDTADSQVRLKKALNTWEQDARQLLTASNEGMPGSEEGIHPDEHSRLGEVLRAKDTMDEKPKHEPSH